MGDTRRLLVVGAGGYGRSVAEAALASQAWVLAGFADDRGPELGAIWGYPVLGSFAQLGALRNQADAVVIAMGDNTRRHEMFTHAQECGFELATIVHPRAHVSPSATVGKGVTIMAGALIGCEARIGDGAIVNTGAIVDHHAELGAFAHLGVGACLPGGSVLGPHAWLQENCALRPTQRVAPSTVIRASAHEA